MVGRTTEQVNRIITLHDNMGFTLVPNTSYLLHDFISELQIPRRLLKSSGSLLYSWHSDTAMGVIGHPTPMAKYELIAPPADPLGSYLREKNTLGYQSCEKATILGFAKPAW